MKRNTLVQTLKATSFVIGVIVLLQGCGNLKKPTASIDQNSLLVSVSQNPIISSDPSPDPSSTLALTKTMGEEGGHRLSALMGEEGGHRTISMYSLATSIQPYYVQISGKAVGCDSVIVNIDGKELSLTLDAQGNFSALIAVDAIPQSISFTPMEGGFLGDVYNFDIAKMTLIP